MIADLTIWIAWIVGVVIVVTLIVLTWHALFADKSRGRRRCPACWHDLTGIDALRCPECGHVPLTEQDLFRTHRHYSRAALWMLILVGGALYLRVKATQQGFVAYLPTTALVWLMPYGAISNGPPDDVQLELVDRIARETLDESTLRRIVNAVIAGDSDARPCSLEWQARYRRIAEMIAYVDSTVSDTDDPIHAAATRLRELPPYVVMSANRPTRGDAPIVAELNLADWWPPTTEARVRIRDVATGREEEFGLDASAPARFLTVRFAPAAPEEIERDIEIRVRTRPTPTGDATWSEEQVLPMKLSLTTRVPELEPIQSEALDKALEAVFRDGVARWGSGMHPVAFNFDVTQTTTAECSGVQFGVAVDLLEGDVVRRTLHVWWTNGAARSLRSEIMFEDLAALRGLPDDGAGWTMRVRGLEELASRATVASTALNDNGAPVPPTKFWSGDRTFPAKVAPRTGESFRRRWFKPPAE